jgi:hypothetical protein
LRFPSEPFQARIPPEKIDSPADDVKPLVPGLLRQISGLTARVDELVAQCNDMHGLLAPDVPDDRRGDEAVVCRADAVVAQFVAAIQRSPVWTGPSNFAVVITRDEGAVRRRARRRGAVDLRKTALPIFAVGTFRRS